LLAAPAAYAPAGCRAHFISMPPPSLNYRASVAARLLAATVGGYVLTSSAITALALLLPLAPAEAALTATMLSFAIYASVVLVVFAIRSVWRMAACVVAAIVILELIVRAAAG
jgi:hypothetical protein